MKPEPGARISDLYHRALARPPEERSAFLQRACDGDTALRREVESLLGYESAAAPFLESPAADVAAGAFASVAGSTQMVGRQLGPSRFCRCWVLAGWARCIAREM